jgi:hypothetical protein
MFGGRAAAKQIFASSYESLRDKSYQELRGLFLDNEQITEITNPSGKRYDLEVVAYWDDKPEGALRVFVTLTPASRWRLLGSIDDTFIKTPQ